MTSASLRATLDRLGLTQLALAELLDVNPRSVRAWCAKPPQRTAPIPTMLELLLDMMERFPDAWRHSERRASAKRH